MNTHDAKQTREDRLEQYLDGLLVGDELATFERELESDPALQEQVALQRRIDASMERAFAPPTESARDSPLAARDGVVARVGPRGFRRAFAVAASVAVVGAAAGLSWWTMQPNCDRPNPLAPVSPDQYYHTLVDCGFEPDWVCGTDAEFRTASARYVGVPFTVASAPGLDVVGWMYQNPGVMLARSSTTLLARSDGEPVVVVMDRVDRDAPVTIDPASELHLHRTERAGVVFYEVSPFTEPRVITRLQD